MIKRLLPILLLALTASLCQVLPAQAIGTLETALNQKGFTPGPTGIELARASCLARELYLDGTSSYTKLSSPEILALRAATTPNIPKEAVEGVNANLTCQYAYFLRDGKVARLFPISSGRPGHETRPGIFKIWYQYNGWWDSTLYPGAMMYRPKYFDGDSALHGLKTDAWVYPYPNSHGCLRTPIATMNYLWKNMVKTDHVRIYGKYIWAK